MTRISTHVRTPTRPTPRRALLAGLIGAAALAVPAGAHAHGGAEIAQGQREGVSVVVQGAQLDDGAAGVHMAANVTGEAAPDPEAVRVRFVVRDGSGETFARRASSDGTAIHDVDIPQGDHGPWEEWDVSALVALADGRTVRVTNATDDPPTLEPAEEDRDRGEAAATSGAGGGPGATPAQAAAARPVDATQAETGTPGWVLPSGVAIVVLAAVGTLLLRRRRAGGAPAA